MQAVTVPDVSRDNFSGLPSLGITKQKTGEVLRNQCLSFALSKFKCNKVENLRYWTAILFRKQSGTVFHRAAHLPERSRAEKEAPKNGVHG